jgi:hypothetical protein
MSPSQILVEAYKRGRAWHPDPEFANLHNLDLAAVEKMSGEEPDAKLLIRSLQLSDANYDPLVLAYHDRTPDYDGEIGEATEHLVEIQRCPIPDFAPPPGATFDFGDEFLNEAVRSYQEYAEAYTGGSGGWPVAGCDPENKGIHSIRVRINPSGAPSNVVGYREKALEAVVASYADIGISVRYLWDSNSAAEITKTFTRLGGGTLGVNYFPRGGCSVITGVLNTTYGPADWRWWAELEGHETGHGVGLPHTRGGRMNPSILLTTNTASWRGDPSEPLLRRLYGGQPIPGRPNPKPDEPQPGPTADAEFTLGGVVYEIRKKGISPPPIVV